jgi:YHS domain-containing protein
MPGVASSVKQISATRAGTFDPKCGMEINRSKAAAEGNTLTRGGKAYYFCSRACKDEFKKNPEKYLGTDQSIAGIER